MKTNVDFGEVLRHLKENPEEHRATRSDWYGSHAAPTVWLQVPDKHSKMTEPYLFMEKFDAGKNIVRFPLDLSCESILAETWVLHTGDE